MRAGRERFPKSAQKLHPKPVGAEEGFPDGRGVALDRAAEHLEILRIDARQDEDDVGDLHFRVGSADRHAAQPAETLERLHTSADISLQVAEPVPDMDVAVRMLDLDQQDLGGRSRPQELVKGANSFKVRNLDRGDRRLASAVVAGHRAFIGRGARRTAPSAFRGRRGPPTSAGFHNSQEISTSVSPAESDSASSMIMCRLPPTLMWSPALKTSVDGTSPFKMQGVGIPVGVRSHIGIGRAAIDVIGAIDQVGAVDDIFAKAAPAIWVTWIPGCQPLPRAAARAAGPTS
jgi:hypothetical protein